MFANPITRTLAALGFHARHDEDTELRPVFGDANGELPTPIDAPPTRIPPHMRHLHIQRDDALRGYSMGSYRPAASMVTEDESAKKAAKTHKAGKASPATA